MALTDPIKLGSYDWVQQQIIERLGELGTAVDAIGPTGVDTANSPAANEFARFTDADTIEGRTAAEVRAQLNVEDGADVTDAANVAAAGAVMESDTSTAAMSFVIDEDNMVSDSATKVPTQQSVKAYVDANIGGGVDTANSPNANEFARFTDADTIEGRTVAEVLTQLNVESGADVTDATNVAAAGAVMEADTSTASMAFVVDEDSMASNSATKVPTQQSVKAYVDTSVSAVTFSKSITVESPTASEDISFFFAASPITITLMQAVLNGSATPSVTWTVRFGFDRSGTGTEVVTGGTTTTDTTLGDEIIVFTDPTIGAGRYIWLETTAKSGTVDALAVTIFYTED